ncbi:hypothetical protein KI387_028298, partial [Taxus chinensis]
FFSYSSTDFRESVQSPTEMVKSLGNQLALVSPLEVPLVSLPETPQRATTSSVQRRPKWFYSTIQDLRKEELSSLLDGILAKLISLVG